MRAERDVHRPGDAAAFSRELYGLWSFIARRRPKLLNAGLLAKRDLKALVEEDSRLPAISGRAGITDELDLPAVHFRRQLLQQLDLTVREGNVVLALPAAARQHWGLPLADRAFAWLGAWTALTEWRELDFLPDTYWYQDSPHKTANQISQARQTVLSALGKAAAGSDWVVIDDVIAELKTSQRDFLVPPRPKRSYGGSTRYDYYNNTVGWSFNPYLREDDGWRRVEGSFVRLVLLALNWLGLVDQDTPDGTSATAFRLTPLGRHILAAGPAPELPAIEGARIVLQPNFHLVAFGPVSELDLLDIERFADRLTADRALEFNLTRESVYRAQQGGMGADDVSAALSRLTGAPIPQNVARSLDEWQAAHERVVIYRRVSLLQTADEPSMAALANGDVGRRALRSLAPNLALIRDERALAEQLVTVGVAPVVGHDRSGRGMLALADDGQVTFRHPLPDIYTLGQVQRLADWDETTATWHLNAHAARRALDTSDMSAEQQITAWRNLTSDAAPEWLEQRTKAWCGYYGTATLTDTVLLELRDAEVLAALQSAAGKELALTPLAAKGVIVMVRREDVAAVRDWLAELGVGTRDD